MSRAAVVAVVVGVGLLGGVIAIDAMYWGRLVALPRGELAAAIGLGIYGACLFPFGLHRIVHPRLDVPVLAYPVLLAFVIMRTKGAHDRAEREGRLEHYMTEDKKSFGPEGDAIGRGWAIFISLVALGMIAIGILLTVRDG